LQPAAAQPGAQGQGHRRAARSAERSAKWRAASPQAPGRLAPTRKNGSAPPTDRQTSPAPHSLADGDSAAAAAARLQSSVAVSARDQEARSNRREAPSSYRVFLRAPPRESSWRGLGWCRRAGASAVTAGAASWEGDHATSGRARAVAGLRQSTTSTVLAAQHAVGSELCCCRRRSSRYAVLSSSWREARRGATSARRSLTRSSTQPSRSCLGRVAAH